jgi:hypothetical protein
LSNHSRHNVRMKIQINSPVCQKSERLITTFGRARLVCLRDGSVELRGGRAHDQTTAKEWISLFMHEAVPRFAN